MQQNVSRSEWVPSGDFNDRNRNKNHLKSHDDDAESVVTTSSIGIRSSNGNIVISLGGIFLLLERIAEKRIRLSLSWDDARKKIEATLLRAS